MTNWRAPSELPDLTRVDDNLVAIDTETNDEGLRADRGSSWPWHGGWVCGIPVAWREGGKMRAIYIPLRHPETDNFDPTRVARWLQDHIAAGVRFVTLNGPYDWGWLEADLGIKMPPSAQLEEVGVLAALVDENQFRYSLDALCERYNLPGKDMTVDCGSLRQLKCRSAPPPSRPEPEPRKLRQSERPGVDMNDLLRSIPKARLPSGPGRQQRRFNGLWHYYD